MTTHELRVQTLEAATLVLSKIKKETNCSGISLCCEMFGAKDYLMFWTPEGNHITILLDELALCDLQKTVLDERIVNLEEKRQTLLADLQVVETQIENLKALPAHEV